MATPTYTSTLTIGELEASYPMYCKALRILVRDGVSENKARCTVCWSRLATLHSSLPRQYRDPRQLFFLLRREQGPFARLEALLTGVPELQCLDGWLTGPQSAAQWPMRRRVSAHDSGPEASGGHAPERIWIH